MATKPQLQSLSLPLKTRVTLKLSDYVTDTVRRDNFTVNRSMFNLFTRHVSANPKPVNSVSSHDITVNAAKNLWFRVYVPHTTTASSAVKLPVMVFFHGGGFVFLNASSRAYDVVCRRFARQMDVILCSVDYRLAPENKFPAQNEDGFDVLAFLDKNRHEITSWPKSADVSRCFLMGDSAGGNISHNVAVKACTTRFDALKIIGLINIQPFFGGTNEVKSEVELEGAPIVSLERTKWIWNALLPPETDIDHSAVNVSGPNAVDLKGLDYPETLVFIGGFDPLKDRQRNYYEWLKSSGIEVKLVEYGNGIHAFYVFPELPETDLLFNQVKEFIYKVISKS